MWELPWCSDPSVAIIHCCRGTKAPPTFSRGQSSTSSDAIVQHAIIKTNPPSNEPVRWLNSPMILGPTNPPMLAVQLMKPTAAAAAELERNELGSAQNEGRYAVVPKPIKVNTTMSSAFECGARSHAPSASA